MLSAPFWHKNAFSVIKYKSYDSKKYAFCMQSFGDVLVCEDKSDSLPAA